ncbi:MAG: low-specificity L-threonine aldolase [Gammaproteobacteria bacterium]|nr:low-specificity L-threonine aldolase [Gammaproteobacteria bacterium]MBU6510081.1 low-specificity L-threonine aldolase [Gammaproteobacteria bacterium]MDE2109110.1 low-specificity L-threonine aldolase [Gammaproteobacteria bacterium]
MIDLRSDTVTRPTAAMRQAMAAAEVGDDVFGDDPTVNRLQDRLAELTGQEAGLFFPSGTQSNLAALMAHCGRGDEFIIGSLGHSFGHEAGGAAVLGSLWPCPIENEADGSLALDKLAAAIKPDDAHFAPTRLLVLENTQNGRVLPLAYIREAAEFARRHQLGIHLDGARAFNAAVKLGVPVIDITRHFDSVSLCLSKGLGCPVGTVLVGKRELIRKAQRARKILGGGMRQAGMLAAAGLYALEHHVQRLAEDHTKARQLAEGLAQIQQIQLDPATVQTNMVFAGIAPQHVQPLAAHLKNAGILILTGANLRLVTHLDVGARDVDTVIAAFRAYFRSA